MKTCPIASYGCSTGLLPIHISTTKVPQSAQKVIELINSNLDTVVFTNKGKKYRIAMDIIRASTPPSLFGMDRRIAYIGKKYHSG